MKLIAENIAELAISEALEDLLIHCELDCHTDCCGIGAFYFSPLIMAHYFMSQNFASPDIGTFPEKCFKSVKADVARLMKIAKQYKSAPETIGFIKCLNQEFTPQGLETFLTEIETNLRGAKQVAELSESIGYRKRK